MDKRLWSLWADNFSVKPRKIECLTRKAIVMERGVKSIRLIISNWEIPKDYTNSNVRLQQFEKSISPILETVPLLSTTLFGPQFVVFYNTICESKYDYILHKRWILAPYNEPFIVEKLDVRPVSSFQICTFI